MKQFRLLICVFLIAVTSNVVSQTVYTTKSGEKYHKSSCRYLKYSKQAIDLDKAKALGYAACKVCKPTKDNTIEPNAIAPDSKRDTSAKKTNASQCTGKTKAGKRCKRMTKSANGRCYQH